MKHIFFTITFLAISIFCSTNVNAQSFISYEVNGKSMSLADGAFMSFTAYRTGTSTGKNLCKYLTATVMSSANVEYEININLNIALSKMPTVGTYPLGEDIAFIKKVPIGYLKLVKKIGEEYLFYATQKNAKGSITITNVDGDWIEGTFEGEVIPQYPIKNKTPLKITNGKLSIR
jgi:hypothetical protein